MAASAITAAVGNVISKRPAEWATAATGSIGLLLSTFVAKNDEEVRTALVVILAALPAAISYLYDLGRFGSRGRPLAHNLTQELDELALRALRRARLGDSGWVEDAKAVKRLVEMRNSLGPVPGPGKANPDGQPPSDGKTKPDPKAPDGPEKVEAG